MLDLAGVALALELHCSFPGSPLPVKSAHLPFGGLYGCLLAAGLAPGQDFKRTQTLDGVVPHDGIEALVTPDFSKVAPLTDSVAPEQVRYFCQQFNWAVSFAGERVRVPGLRRRLRDSGEQHNRHKRALPFHFTGQLASGKIGKKMVGNHQVDGLRLEELERCRSIRCRERSEERRVGKECRSRGTPYH